MRTAKGSKRKGDEVFTQIVVRVGDDLFEEVQQLAIANRITVTAQIRTLIELGLMNLKPKGKPNG